MTKIVRVGSSLGVIVPVNILRGMNWQRGDVLVFSPMDNDVLALKRLSDKEVRELRDISRFMSYD